MTEPLFICLGESKEFQWFRKTIFYEWSPDSLTLKLNSATKMKAIHVKFSKTDSHRKIYYRFCSFIREIQGLRRQERYFCFDVNPFTFDEDDRIYEEKELLNFPTKNYIFIP